MCDSNVSDPLFYTHYRLLLSYSRNSLKFLSFFILTTRSFGHYVAARKATLDFFEKNNNNNNKNKQKTKNIHPKIVKISQNSQKQFPENRTRLSFAHAHTRPKRSVSALRPRPAIQVVYEFIDHPS